LETLSPGLREQFESAAPSRHIVIDGFLPPEEAQAIADTFPKPFGSDRVLATVFAARTYRNNLADIDRHMSRAFEMLASASFISWLEELTGIPSLQIDSDFIGAGLHQAVNGSSLPVHADHNTHPKNDGLYRRLNLLIYMNPIWKTEWGGILELWDPNAAAPTVSIEPILNRCIIMEVTDRAFHGYRRLRVPDGTARNAVVAYYYSPQPSPEQQALPHPTLFPAAGQSRPEQLFRRLRHGALLRVLAAKERFTVPRSSPIAKKNNDAGAGRRR
jgi:Rps23 Pro-64 3,4-dihydroxylase Tpa1-like proline 4-hydroxylase